MIWQDNTMTSGGNPRSQRDMDKQLELSMCTDILLGNLNMEKRDLVPDAKSCVKVTRLVKAYDHSKRSSL